LDFGEKKKERMKKGFLGILGDFLGEF